MAKVSKPDEVSETEGRFTPDVDPNLEPAGEGDPVAAARENRRVAEDRSAADYNRTEPHTGEALEKPDEPDPAEAEALAAKEVSVAQPDGAAERPAAKDNRNAWNAYAESIGLNPADYGTKEELVKAVEKAEK